MALLNPVYAFVVPFLFVVTVPLAVFAGITTTVAFSVLILRVLAVYLDVVISLIPHYLGGRKPRLHDHPARIEALNAAATNLSSSPNSTPSNTPLRRRRRRRSSSAISAASLTPAASETALGLLPSIGPTRDFEGVGGWRLGDDEEWTTINSRLELPDKQHHGRNHYRPPSGPTTPGEGPVLMMKSRTSNTETKRSSASPNSSRTRTPSGPRIAFAAKPLVDSYFPMLKTAPKAPKKPSQGLVEA
ncbi:hypothetical protein B0J13DRAFT_125213 [Dactylonectria estremocensis]|uniref:Uncharacterized protein n=1 Tax=Dactylonectria estremocensis TaxID=1079267 RepID=A0A9P9JIL0_9HYPO|nr:hypothetical protein B0J13DRAFT_125213 [Dactylonectria estremocensis]